MKQDTNTTTWQARHVLRVRCDGEMYHGPRPWYPCSVERAVHYVELGLPVRLVTGKPPKKRKKAWGGL